MGWASHHIQKLQERKTVTFRPRGNSMSGKIENGQIVTVEPVRDCTCEVGGIVLCKVNGAEYLHLVRRFRANGCRLETTADELMAGRREGMCLGL